MTRRSICIIVCGAGPAAHVGTLVELAQSAGWSVQILATPTGLAFIDADALERLTDRPVRSDYSPPGQPRAHNSAADAVIIAPATYNTINKLAAGINDTYALNVAAEAIGRGTPTAILPFINTALAARRPFQQAVTALRSEDVHVLLGPGQWTPHPPGTGGDHLATFPWRAVLDAVTPKQ